MTNGVNLTAQLQAAHTTLARGDASAARRLVEAVLRAAPDAAPALHLLALVEKAAGRPAAARAAFARAALADPRDPEIASNFGNLLDDLGERDAAIAQLRRAVALRPGFADAWANLGIVLDKAGDSEAARAALEGATALAPGMLRAWTALALVCRAADDPDGAARAADRALALRADAPRALHARALIAADRGEPDVVARYARAVAAAPADREAALGLAVARHEAGDSDAAEAALAALVARHPEWRDGHVALARLRAQLGRDDALVASLDAALAARPRDVVLWLTKLDLLGRAGRHAEARATALTARVAAGDEPRFDLARAIAESELGDPAAGARFAALETRLPGARDLAAFHTRHLLRTSDAQAAEARIAPLATAATGDALAWAYRETAWRLLGDPRHDWLIDVRAMTGTLELGLDAAELAATATRLRALHTAREAPLDQTLRGGTQTSGTLFLRADPAIRRLRDACFEAVGRFVAALPPRREGHPLLGRLPATPAFAGSWSVRLRGSGAHINHVHPEGWLSSALYVALPDGLGGPDHAGWLTLGEPPAELGLGLPPLRLIEPQVGRLALFPAFLWHGTRAFAAGERLTVAFDVVTP